VFYILWFKIGLYSSGRSFGSSIVVYM